MADDSTTDDIDATRAVVIPILVYEDIRGSA